MPLLKPKSDVNQNEIKRGEEKLKSIIGGQIVRNRPFYAKMARNGIRNTPKAWHKINSQIRKELKDGQLSPDDVEKRIDEMILEISGRSEILSPNSSQAAAAIQLKQQILTKGKVAVQIPYRASGIGGSVRGNAVWGQTGAFLGSLEEGSTKWKGTDLLFIDGGISIKSTGQVALYENINKVVTGETGLLFTIVTVITETGDNIIFKTGNQNAVASKSIIEDNLIKKIPQATAENKASDADELLKYAQLYEKGLLTKEEFETKKHQILHAEDVSLKEEYLNETKEDSRPKFCQNCGSPLDENSNFCSNCGEKII